MKEYFADKIPMDGRIRIYSIPFQLMEPFQEWMQGDDGMLLIKDVIWQLIDGDGCTPAAATIVHIGFDWCFQAFSVAIHDPTEEPSRMQWDEGIRGVNLQNAETTIQRIVERMKGAAIEGET